MAAILTEKNGLVMSGYLYYKAKKLNKYWAELHRETSRHPRELRLFQSKSKADDSSTAVVFESIVLNNVLELNDKQRNISGHPAFQIVSMKMRYQLCAENKQELNHWVEIIRQELFGLPKVGIIYEFMVMVIDNPSAKRYSLVGNYTLKVDNRNVMLYSANGLIQTNFSVPIEQIWRLKLAPSSDKDSIYSNFVVLDIIGGGVLLLMSASSTDIARIVSHRRRLLSGYKHHETTGGEAVHGTHHGVEKKTKTTPSIMPSVCASYDSPLFQKRFLEFEMSNGNADKMKHAVHSVSNSYLQNGKLDILRLTPLKHIKSETAVRASGSANDSFEVGKYRDGTISRRPPQPVPRSPNNMQHKMYSPVMGSVSPCASSSNGTATSGIEHDGYYVVPAADYQAVTGSHNDEEVYSYAYGDHQRHCMAEDDVYFITNDEILELRRNIKPRGNRSIKGSKSMENLVY